MERHGCRHLWFPKLPAWRRCSLGLHLGTEVELELWVHWGRTKGSGHTVCCLFWLICLSAWYFLSLPIPCLPLPIPSLPFPFLPFLLFFLFSHFFFFFSLLLGDFGFEVRHLNKATAALWESLVSDLHTVVQGQVSRSGLGGDVF